MAENLSCDWRALIGPWPHAFPDECRPGPAIGYSQECLRFWDYHLKGIENGISKEPRFRVYLQESTTSFIINVNEGSVYLKAYLSIDHLKDIDDKKKNIIPFILASSAGNSVYL